jgi:glycosyltransferase involved in cell wall biosynthesis
MRLLLITTRNPESTIEQDGGAVFAAQIIGHLAPRAELDILFLRSPDTDIPKLAGLNAAYFLAPDMSITNRFRRRIATAHLVTEWLYSRYQKYDAILVQHASGGFGIVQLSESAIQRVIVFPMFTGIAYRRSGEDVPPEYLDWEKKVLRSAKLILCASRSEALDIVEGYGVNAAHIAFAPFGIDLGKYAFCPRTLQRTQLQLLYVATIKKQKNQLESLLVLEGLLELGLQARLHLVGLVGDPLYYAELQRRAEERGLQDLVTYHGVLTPDGISLIAAGCSFSISTSHWETFGIAIFESLAMGLPAITYDDVACLQEYFQPKSACIGVPRDHDAMARRIATFYDDPADYAQRSARAREEIAHLGTANVMQGVFEKIKISVNGGS